MNDIFTHQDDPATAHGWLRRPELDTDTFDAWEMPDGMMYPARKGITPRIVTVWQEPSP